MTIFPQRLWSDLNCMCVCMCVLSGSVEQSWAQRSIASSIIHQKHTNDIDWAGSGGDAEHALSETVCLFFLPSSESAISLWKQSADLSEYREENQTSFFIKVRSSVLWQHKSRKSFSYQNLTSASVIANSVDCRNYPSQRTVSEEQTCGSRVTRTSSVTDWPSMWQSCSGWENSVDARACPHTDVLFHTQQPKEEGPAAGWK